MMARGLVKELKFYSVCQCFFFFFCKLKQLFKFVKKYVYIMMLYVYTLQTGKTKKIHEITFTVYESNIVFVQFYSTNTGGELLKLILQLKPQFEKKKYCLLVDELLKDQNYLIRFVLLSSSHWQQCEGRVERMEPDRQRPVKRQFSGPGKRCLTRTVAVGIEKREQKGETLHKQS